MVSSLSYAQLTQRAIDNDRSKMDFLVPSKEMCMENDSHMRFDDKLYGINATAHNQLAGRLKIPTQFYHRMSEYSGLRTEVVDRLLSEDDRTFMLRTLNGDARAFLSDRYKPIDNVEVLTAAAPVLRDMPITFRSADISETRMYLQVSFPGMEAEVQVGDVVQYGLTISNSEVGMGMVRVSPTLWRLVCQNGMIRHTEIQHRHVGKQMDMGEDFSIYRDETIEADRVAFRLKLQDTIQQSVQDSYFASLLDASREASEDKVENIVKTVKNVTRHFGMSEGLEEELINSMALDMGAPSRWKIANAVTGMCHKDSKSDAQFEYEKIGAQIVDMKPAIWKGIAA
jgi:hypothetical protein